jgi:hypothetical protein|tara:strand:- start:498 stop:689 length:192 start_codon:yes stop_codon:yes gene_type:complete
MNEEEINRLADEISFRLMATKEHPDHEWLVGRLRKAQNELADKLIDVIKLVQIKDEIHNATSN